MKNTATNKTLIITGLSQNLQPLFPRITNKKTEELIITNSLGHAITHPYGCMIRDIIMAIYYKKVNDIYFIAEKDGVEFLTTEDEFLDKFQEHGISKSTIQTLEYIDAVGNNFMNWLVGKPDIKHVIKDNISLIKKHPLIPDSVAVYGFIANNETGEYEAV